MFVKCIVGIGRMLKRMCVSKGMWAGDKNAVGGWRRYSWWLVKIWLVKKQ